ncbi:hypothetical protein [Polaribacter sp.]|uniref:hypothetical protein n=1 Tax=Polaribacter sp. TaxID=1920175 RepID=UPI003EF517CA
MKKRFAILVYLLFTVSAKAQTIDDLMRNFTNSYVATHAEVYEKVIGQSHIHFPTHVRIIDMPSDWVNNTSNLIKSNPSLLNNYLDSDDFDFSAFVLMLSIFEIDPNPKEFSAVSFVLFYYNDDDFSRISAMSPVINTKKDLFSLWLAIKDTSINRVKSFIAEKCGKDSDGDGINDCEDDTP